MLARFLTEQSAMSVKINGQQQMSFEQFEETFKQAFGREMTPDERRWLRLSNFLNSDSAQQSHSGEMLDPARKYHQ